jgi:hypothetical protein
MERYPRFSTFSRPSPRCSTERRSTATSVPATATTPTTCPCPGVTCVGRSRAKHLEYAARYIFEQAETSPVNPTTVGTGSTPFMPYLKSHRDETWAHLVR